MRFIIRKNTALPLQRLLEYLEKATEACPQVVEVKDYEQIRKLEQNAYYWGPVVSQVCKHLAENCGRPTEAEVIHELHKRLFQPVVGSFETQAKCGDEWFPIEQTVHKSTTKNTVKEMAEFIQQVEAYWADQGVIFVDNRYG